MARHSQGFQPRSQKKTQQNRCENQDTRSSEKGASGSRAGSNGIQSEPKPRKFKQPPNTLCLPKNYKGPFFEYRDKTSSSVEVSRPSGSVLSAYKNPTDRLSSPTGSVLGAYKNSSNRWSSQEHSEGFSFGPCSETTQGVSFQGTSDSFSFPPTSTAASKLPSLEDESRLSQGGFDETASQKFEQLVDVLSSFLIDDDDTNRLPNKATIQQLKDCFSGYLTEDDDDCNDETLLKGVNDGSGLSTSSVAREVKQPQLNCSLTNAINRPSGSKAKAVQPQAKYFSPDDVKQSCGSKTKTFQPHAKWSSPDDVNRSYGSKTKTFQQHVKWSSPDDVNRSYGSKTKIFQPPVKWSSPDDDNRSYGSKTKTFQPLAKWSLPDDVNRSYGSKTKTFQPPAKWSSPDDVNTKLRSKAIVSNTLSKKMCLQDDIKAPSESTKKQAKEPASKLSPSECKNGVSGFQRELHQQASTGISLGSFDDLSLVVKPKTFKKPKENKLRKSKHEDMETSQVTDEQQRQNTLTIVETILENVDMLPSVDEQWQQHVPSAAAQVNLAEDDDMDMLPPIDDQWQPHLHAAASQDDPPLMQIEDEVTGPTITTSQPQLVNPPQAQNNEETGPTVAERQICLAALELLPPPVNPPPVQNNEVTGPRVTESQLCLAALGLLPPPVNPPQVQNNEVTGPRVTESQLCLAALGLLPPPVDPPQVQNNNGGTGPIVFPSQSPPVNPPQVQNNEVTGPSVTESQLCLAALGLLPPPVDPPRVQNNNPVIGPTVTSSQVPLQPSAELPQVQANEVTLHTNAMSQLRLAALVPLPEQEGCTNTVSKSLETNLEKSQDGKRSEPIDDEWRTHTLTIFEDEREEECLQADNVPQPAAVSSDSDTDSDDDANGNNQPSTSQRVVMLPPVPRRSPEPPSPSSSENDTGGGVFLQENDNGQTSTLATGPSVSRPFHATMGRSRSGSVWRRKSGNVFKSLCTTRREAVRERMRKDRQRLWNNLIASAGNVLGPILRTASTNQVVPSAAQVPNPLLGTTSQNPVDTSAAQVPNPLLGTTSQNPVDTSAAQVPNPLLGTTSQNPVDPSAAQVPNPLLRTTSQNPVDPSAAQVPNPLLRTTSQNPVDPSAAQVPNPLLGTSSRKPVDTSAAQVPNPLLGTTSQNQVDTSAAQVPNPLLGTTSQNPVDLSAAQVSNTLLGTTSQNPVDTSAAQVPNPLLGTTSQNPVDTSAAQVPNPLLGTTSQNPVDTSAAQVPNPLLGTTSQNPVDPSAAQVPNPLLGTSSRKPVIPFVVQAFNPVSMTIPLNSLAQAFDPFSLAIPALCLMQVDMETEDETVRHEGMDVAYVRDEEFMEFMSSVSEEDITDPPESLEHVLFFQQEAQRIYQVRFCIQPRATQKSGEGDGGSDSDSEHEMDYEIDGQPQIPVYRPLGGRGYHLVLMIPLRKLNISGLPTTTVELVNRRKHKPDWRRPDLRLGEVKYSKHSMKEKSKRKIMYDNLMRRKSRQQRLRRMRLNQECRPPSLKFMAPVAPSTSLRRSRFQRTAWLKSLAKKRNFLSQQQVLKLQHENLAVHQIWEAQQRSLLAQSQFERGQQILLAEQQTVQTQQQIWVQKSFGMQQQSVAAAESLATHQRVEIQQHTASQQSLAIHQQQISQQQNTATQGFVEQANAAGDSTTAETNSAVESKAEMTNFAVEETSADLTSTTKQADAIVDPTSATEQTDTEAQPTPVTELEDSKSEKSSATELNTTAKPDSAQEQTAEEDPVTDPSSGAEPTELKLTGQETSVQQNVGEELSSVAEKSTLVKYGKRKHALNNVGRWCNVKRKQDTEAAPAPATEQADTEAQPTPATELEDSKSEKTSGTELNTTTKPDSAQEQTAEEDPVTDPSSGAEPTELKLTGQETSVQQNVGEELSSVAEKSTCIKYGKRKRALNNVGRCCNVKRKRDTEAAPAPATELEDSKSEKTSATELNTTTKPDSAPEQTAEEDPVTDPSSGAEPTELKLTGQETSVQQNVGEELSSVAEKSTCIKYGKRKRALNNVGRCCNVKRKRDTEAAPAPATELEDSKSEKTSATELNTTTKPDSAPEQTAEEDPVTDPSSGAEPTELKLTGQETSVQQNVGEELSSVAEKSTCIKYGKRKRALNNVGRCCNVKRKRDTEAAPAPATELEDSKSEKTSATELNTTTKPDSAPEQTAEEDPVTDPSSGAEPTELKLTGQETSVQQNVGEELSSEAGNSTWVKCGKRKRDLNNVGGWCIVKRMRVS